jgi:hypothetical protein
VALRTFPARATLAWALQDGSLLQAQPAGVRVSWVRTPLERVQKLVPFAEWSQPLLRLDSTRVVWVVDGLVSSRHFPLSTRVPWGESAAGLVRAGYLAVVEAETGVTRIFARPEGGPLADAWTGLAVGVVEPWSSMPDAWRPLADYPAELFRAQSRVLEGSVSGRLVGGADSLRRIPASHAFFWSRESTGPVRSAAYVRGAPAWVGALVVGTTREGRLALDRLEIDSTVALPGPGALQQLWEHFPTYVQVVDSVRAGGGVLSAGGVRYWTAPSGAGATQVHYGPRGGGGTSVTWVSVASGSRLGAGRTSADAWSNLQGSSVPLPPGSAPAGVLGDARKWFRIADSAFRRGDFTAFGRAFEALRAVLEVPPIDSR